MSKAKKTTVLFSTTSVFRKKKKRNGRTGQSIISSALLRQQLKTAKGRPATTSSVLLQIHSSSVHSSSYSVLERFLSSSSS
ncbi:unnamed protein product [Cuscuta campestris]|uniref:Uncharacterized protein n=1 Tax=Cuscuta campestris TaxID=132261 RepID=A0A484NED1_9ASTE|nr:unnamed protein product [Cuscuta campestris]